MFDLTRLAAAAKSLQLRLGFCQMCMIKKGEATKLKVIMDYGH